MLIAGINKASFVDYPGRMSVVIFTPGCNMNCWYCHNSHILSLNSVNIISNADALDFLQKRKRFIDYCVISGGEPTLQRDLPYFIDNVIDIGYKIKLDTNGTNPEMLRQLINGGKLSYIAMDIKAPLDNYAFITGTDNDIEAIKSSIDIIMNSGVDYEFRTTYAPTLHSQDILSIAKSIQGAKAYYLQQYQPYKQAGVAMIKHTPHTPEYIRQTAEAVKGALGVCEVRGI